MLVVFDLDFTLWNCGNNFIDGTHPPFEFRQGDIYDRSGRQFYLYNDVVTILTSLKAQNKYIGAASRTNEPSWAINLLKMYDIDKYFDFKEIFPDSKVQHFTNLRERSKLPFEEMYFFDDEYRNVQEVGALGVNCQHVADGITTKLVENLTGLKIS